MEENTFEPTPVVPNQLASKTPAFVGVLALVGAGTLAKKGFNKVRQFRVVRKDRLDELENQSSQTK